MALTLSRIVETLSGQILIDDQDISKLPLELIRNKITVIPQDAMMFTGTLKFNLDPQDQY